MGMNVMKMSNHSLADVKVGKAAVIEAVGLTGSERGRIQALGFVPGTTVEVVRRAPLGDPIEYALRGYRICLRASEARHIQVGS